MISCSTNAQDPGDAAKAVPGIPEDDQNKCPGLAAAYLKVNRCKCQAGCCILHGCAQPLAFSGELLLLMNVKSQESMDSMGLAANWMVYSLNLV